MRKIVDVLRLKFETGLSHERIAAATKVSKGAVTKYVQRAREAGLGGPLPPEMDEARLEALLFPQAAPAVERYAAPDFALHQELKSKGVTLQLLWEEYRTAHAGQAYRYSQFCLLYHRFAQSLKRSMRQVHSVRGQRPLRVCAPCGVWENGLGSGERGQRARRAGCAPRRLPHSSGLAGWCLHAEADSQGHGVGRRHTHLYLC
jgi:transposase